MSRVLFQKFDVNTRRLTSGLYEFGSIRALREVDIQCEPDESWVLVEGFVDPAASYVNRDGEIRALPEGGVPPDDLPPY